MPRRRQDSAREDHCSTGMYWLKEGVRSGGFEHGVEKSNGPLMKTSGCVKGTASAQAIYLLEAGEAVGENSIWAPKSMIPSAAVVYSCHSGHQRAEWSAKRLCRTGDGEGSDSSKGQ
jgi:hypothetical protein